MRQVRICAGNMIAAGNGSCLVDGDNIAGEAREPEPCIVFGRKLKRCLDGQILRRHVEVQLVVHHLICQIFFAGANILQHTAGSRLERQLNGGVLSDTLDNKLAILIIIIHAILPIADFDEDFAILPVSVAHGQRVTGGFVSLCEGRHSHGQDHDQDHKGRDQSFCFH